MQTQTIETWVNISERPPVKQANYRVKTRGGGILQPPFSD